MTRQANTHRAVDVLLRAQAAGSAGVSLRSLAHEWDVHERTVRRLASAAIEAAERHRAAGRLERSGRGRTARLIWIPRNPFGDVHATEAVALLAALGPWRSLGYDDVASTLERLVAVAGKGARAHMRRNLDRLARTGVWYQPFGRRPHRDPEVLDQVLSALLHSVVLTVAHYASPSEAGRPLELEIFTLVHAYDGLYVLGRERRDDSSCSSGRRSGPDRSSALHLWALHRMEDVAFDRTRRVTVPADFDPSIHLGHGYGPFIADSGETELFVPDAEAPYVLEYELPSQLGEPAQVKGGWRVRVATPPHPGVWLWARWMGVEIVDPVDG
jgi:hypothetical protein